MRTGCLQCDDPGNSVRRNVLKTDEWRCGVYVPGSIWPPGKVEDQSWMSITSLWFAM